MRDHKLASKWIAKLRQQLSDAKKRPSTKKPRFGYMPSVLLTQQSDPRITMEPAHD